MAEPAELQAASNQIVRLFEDFVAQIKEESNAISIAKTAFWIAAFCLLLVGLTVYHAIDTNSMIKSEYQRLLESNELLQQEVEIEQIYIRDLKAELKARGYEID